MENQQEIKQNEENVTEKDNKQQNLPTLIDLQLQQQNLVKGVQDSFQQYQNLQISQNLDYALTLTHQESVDIYNVKNQNHQNIILAQNSDGLLNSEKQTKNDPNFQINSTNNFSLSTANITDYQNQQIIKQQEKDQLQIEQQIFMQDSQINTFDIEYGIKNQLLIQENIKQNNNINGLSEMFDFDNQLKNQLSENPYFNNENPQNNQNKEILDNPQNDLITLNYVMEEKKEENNENQQYSSQDHIKSQQGSKNNSGYKYKSPSKVDYYKISKHKYSGGDLDSEIAKNLSIHSWDALQEQLKEEINIVSKETEFKDELLEKLKFQVQQYYKNYIKQINLEDSVRFLNSQERQKLRYTVVDPDKVFNFTSQQIKVFLYNLGTNPKLINYIFKNHQIQLTAQKENSLTRSIINGLYDEVIDNKTWDNKLYTLLAQMLKQAISNISKPSDLKLIVNNFNGKLLKEFIRKYSFRQYLDSIKKVPLFNVTRIDYDLRMHKKNDNSAMKSLNKTQHFLKMSQIIEESTKKNISKQQTNITVSDFQSSLQDYNNNQNGQIDAYEKIFKRYKQDSRTNQVINSLKIDQKAEQAQVGQKQKVSNQNQNLQSEENYQFPNQEQQINVLNKNRTESINLNQNNLQDQNNNQNIQFQSPNKKIKKSILQQIDKRQAKLEELIHIFMQSIFDNLYHLPTGVRIIVKIIEILIMEKFPNTTKKEIYSVISNFLFDNWMLPQFQFPQHYVDLKLIRAVHNINLMEIRKVLQKIFSNQKFTDPDYLSLNDLVEEYEQSIKQYYDEILNINQTVIKDIIQKSELPLVEDKSNLYVPVICMNVQDIETLIEMTCSCLDNIKENFPQEEKIIKQAQKLYNFSKDKDLNIFGEKNNISKNNPNKVYQTNQMFIIYDTVKIPQDLDQDFSEILKKIYKVDSKATQENLLLKKCLNVIRQLLIQMESLDNFLQYSSSKNITLSEILQFYKKSNNTILQPEIKLDSIPGPIKAEYFLSMVPQLPKECKENNFEYLYNNLKENLEIRMNNFKNVTEKIKLIVLGSLNLIIDKNLTVSSIINKYKKEINRRQLFNFIKEKQFSYCLTSQKQRDELPYQKLIEQKFDEEQIPIYNQLILEEDQDDCVHSCINIKFLNSLTGQQNQDQKSNNNNNKDPLELSHFSNVKQFIDVFCRFPEVQKVIINGEDKYEVSHVFQCFIQSLMNLIKEETQFDHLTTKEDMENIQDSLEQYITKQIYDRIFPKISTFKDISLFVRIKTLEWVTYDHLEISPFNREDSMWDKAAKALKNIENSRTPEEKLDCLQHCTNTMADILKLTSKKEEAVGADITVPCMVYILLKSQPKKFYTNMNFIQAFANKEKMKTGQGFCFIQMMSVINFLEKLQAQQLKNITQIEFDRNTFQNELEMGITFLKKRPRRERKKYKTEKIKEILDKDTDLFHFLKDFGTIHQKRKITKQNTQIQQNLKIFQKQSIEFQKKSINLQDISEITINEFNQKHNNDYLNSPQIKSSQSQYIESQESNNQISQQNSLKSTVSNDNFIF